MQGNKEVQGPADDSAAAAGMEGLLLLLLLVKHLMNYMKLVIPSRFMP